MNLPPKYRQSTLKPPENQDLTEEFTTIETVPNIKSLLNVLIKELNINNIDLGTFANKILKEDSIFVRNLILTPLPWDMMSLRMKLKYAQIWHWLKQRASMRLKMLGIRPKDFIDTTQIAKDVLGQLKNYDLGSLICDINRGLPASVMNSLLYHPVDWAYANKNER